MGLVDGVGDGGLVGMDVGFKVGRCVGSGYIHRYVCIICICIYVYAIEIKIRIKGEMES